MKKRSTEGCAPLKSLLLPGERRKEEIRDSPVYPLPFPKALILPLPVVLVVLFTVIKIHENPSLMEFWSII